MYNTSMSEKLTTGSIRKHLIRMAVPTSIGFFFNTMFNVVDTFYAGRLGTSALAGMSASFSIFFILTAIMAGTGTGLTALLSNAIGKADGENESASCYSSNGIILVLFLGVVLTIAGTIFAPGLLLLLGARDEAFAAGAQYVRTIYAGSVFFGINAVLNAFLTARGETRPYRNFLIIGFLANLVLDPLLIFGWFGLPRLGTAGVALATVIIQFIGCIFLSWQVRRKTSIRLKDLGIRHFSVSCQGEILGQGIPASINMLTIAVGIFVINLFIYRYGSDASIAGYGAAVRIEQLALLPAIGLNAATLAIIGQNFGAGQLKRVRDTVAAAIKIGLLVMSVGMVLIFPFAPFLVGLFNDNQAVVSEGTRYLRIDIVAFNGYILINVCLSALQGLKKPQYAIFIGIYRQLVMPLILFTFLGTTLGLGLLGIWWGIVITVWTGALAMFVLLIRTFKKMNIPPLIIRKHAGGKKSDS